MSILHIFSIFSIISHISCAIFDLEELKTFNYGIDIRSEPVVMKSESEVDDVSTVKLKSKYGQLYQCSFPNTVGQEKQKEEAEKVAMETGIPDLLKPMESGPCLRKTKDWWSYEFCYGKHIKQFHLAEDGNIDGDVLMLGLYESEYNWEEDIGKSASERRENEIRRYHTQQYVNGTKCDLNGNLRRTEIRFQCEEGSADYIARLDEPETCSYIMTIHTMKICHHPFLKPPTPTRTVTIVCNPLLTILQYHDYLDHMQAKEEEERLATERQEAERLAVEAEKKRLAEQKAKYYKQNQLLNKGLTDEDDGIVEIEGVAQGDTMDGVQQPADAAILPDEDSSLSNDWDKLFEKYADDADVDLQETKTMYKLIQSTVDLKDFLNDVMDETKKAAKELNKAIAAKDGETGLPEDDTEEEEGEENVPKIPHIPTDEPPRYDPVDTSLAGKGAETDPDMEELDQEIKTLKEKYKTKREKLTEFKQKVKTNMEAHYEAIIREAQEELAQDGLETDADSKHNREAIRQLTRTIDSLLDKLDTTEKEIEKVDKELEQFAEYDSDDKVKSIPPVRDTDTPTTATGPAVIGQGQDDERVKVRVSRLKPGQVKGLEDSLSSNKEMQALEKSVQQELEKAGLGHGEKIQVKIITTAYDADDETLQILSEKESETFRIMILDMISGTSEENREQSRHNELEENYSFVWGQDRGQGSSRQIGSDTSGSDAAIHDSDRDRDGHRSDSQTITNTIVNVPGAATDATSVKSQSHSDLKFSDDGSEWETNNGDTNTDNTNTRDQEEEHADL